MWKSHLGGSMNEQYRLWGVLMFQSWLEANSVGTGAEPQLAAVAS
jgi:hypothetical protein